MGEKLSTFNSFDFTTTIVFYPLRIKFKLTQQVSSKYAQYGKFERCVQFKLNDLKCVAWK